MKNTDFINVDRAIHELRSGREIIVDNILLLHPEFITGDRFEEIKATAKLVLTKFRATMVIGKKFAGNVEIALANLSFDDLQYLIAAGGGFPLKLKYIENKNKILKSAIELIKSAELLPCVIYVENVAAKNSLNLTGEVINNYLIKKPFAYLKMVTEAPLNLCDADKAKILAFRSQNALEEHYAIIIGEPASEPLIRIHSSCYTGDLLGSLSCDCGDQLRGAIRLMNGAGGGIIIYLMQEGRGIGLINKLRAYKLQADKGLDTVEANEFLGFDDEERSFESAAAILKLLKISTIKLVTNNPKKISELRKLGIKITDRVPLVTTHQHNKTYLQIKSKKSGHIID